MPEISFDASDVRRIQSTSIGIVGGGQLGLMLSEAARKMGYAGITVLDPTPACPASVIAEQVVGSLKDPAALRQLAARADILTYEIEHISTPVLQALRDESVCMYPAPELLAIIQDKYVQKEFLARHTIPVAPFCAIETRADLECAAATWGYPLVLKARKEAYDGRGNARINRAEDIDSALDRLGGQELYVEQCLELEKELGLMIARNARGDNALYPVVEMRHARDICETVLAPARISAQQYAQAQDMALRAIDSLQGIGIFGIELFLDTAGRIWLNEIAPRPHNLGHYTIEGCATSQFEQHLRAVTNLPLGPTALRYPAVVMENILGTRNGSAEPQWHADYDWEKVFVHLYGKRETRVDRKMGHITVVGEDLDQVYQQAKEARAALSI